MDCCAFCTAKSYSIKPLYEALRTRYKATLYKDVVFAEIHKYDTVCQAFFFSYGVTVVWGTNKQDALRIIETEISHFENTHLDDVETDEFTYNYINNSDRTENNSTNTGNAKIIDDEISLPNNEILTKLAISHGIAQSVKLSTFETSLQKTFNANKHFPEELAAHGKISLSRKGIRQKMGELFLERNSINLHMDVLDTPEFFWEYTELEPLYKMTANYLDIHPRVEILNQRLDVIHGLFEMLGNELNHSHSSRLEWTIIVLIVIEVIISLSRDIFRII